MKDDETFSNYTCYFNTVLLPDCINIGFTIPQFLDLTLKEINIYFKAYEKKKTEETKENLVYIHKLADLIGLSVGRLFQKQGEESCFPDIWDLYPDLFQEEKENAEKEKEKLYWEKYKAQFELFAEMHNNNNKNKGV